MMGCSSTKLLETPTSPLQALQFTELKRNQRKRNEEKWQRQIAKLQKRHAKRQQQQTSTATTTMMMTTMMTATTRRRQLSVSSSERESGTPQSGGSNASKQQTCNMQDHIGQMEQKQQDYERGITQRTCRQLNNELSAFLLNQLVLITQFFGNFESEVSDIFDELLTQEHECNQHLTEQSILFANPLDAAVARWIKYKPMHGADKQQGQPLQTQVMYVVFENIDIAARVSDANYDSISPLCKVLIETDYHPSMPCAATYMELLQATKWKGYVRLELRENAKFGNNYECTDDGGVYTDGSSGYSTTSGFSSGRLSRVGSILVGEGPAYDYVHLERLNTQQPLAMLQLGKETLADRVLPESCVCKLANIVEPWLVDSYDNDDEDDDEDSQAEDEEEEEDNENNGATWENIEASDEPPSIGYSNVTKKATAAGSQLLQQQSYLNSKEFMRFFASILLQKLATQLNISEADLATASYRGCSIYTADYEIVPAIQVAQSWPECAFSFRLRQRPIVPHPVTGEPVQWPTPSMITRIQDFGYHVVPIGYAPKWQRNPFRELEWRIVFPKAERYLERHLSNTQIKIFMLVKALVKSFVERHEKRASLMFAVEHLRAHLFWECERDYCAWPEEFLGDVLLRFIRSFMSCLSRKQLPDFFIEERNLFETIPEDSLVTLHSIMADIAEYPLMHLLVALRNLEHGNTFFPKLNFRKVFENIVEHDLLKLRQLSQHTRTPLCMDQRSEKTSTALQGQTLDESAPVTNGLLGMQQQNHSKVKSKLRKRTQLMRVHIARAQQEQAMRHNHRESLDSIEMELIIAKHTRHTNGSSYANTSQRARSSGLENLRSTNLLELLLTQLLAMSEHALHLQNTKLAQLLNKQARRLCTFYHNLGCELNAQTYSQAIENAATKIKCAIHESNDAVATGNFCAAPALPRRFSGEPTEPCKSIKFVEHVMQVHDIQPSTPVNTLHPPTCSNAATILTPASNRASNTITVDQSQLEDMSPNASVSARLKKQKLHVAIGDDAPVLRELTNKTKALLHNLPSDEKCLELCERLKKHTLKLKNALNQTPDT